MRKKFFAMLITLSMVLGLIAPAAGAAYTDVSGHWAQNTIQIWDESDLVAGYEDGSFRPDNRITRAEVCQIISSLMELDGGSATFTDVAKTAWYYDAIANCYAKGLISGYSDGTMKPENPITRQEVFVMVAKAYGLDTSNAGAAKFADAADIASWALGSVNALVAADRLAGYEDGTVRPGNYVTRAEVLALLENLRVAIEEGKQEEQPDEGGSSTGGVKFATSQAIVAAFEELGYTNYETAFYEGDNYTVFDEGDYYLQPNCHFSWVPFMDNEANLDWLLSQSK